MVIKLTREERQRIAAKLRNAEIENLSTYEYSAHLGEAIGECVRLVSGHEILVKRGLDRLADLIEPEERTCEFDSQACGKRRCKRCCAFVSVDSVWDCFGCIPFKFCPNCGAKVVE